MKTVRPLLVFLLLIASFSAAQSTKPEPKPEPKAETKSEPRPSAEITIGKVLENSVNSVQWNMVPLGTAMPEDKFGFAPTNGDFKGVRTFAEQLKHVAAANFMFASAILGEKPPADIGEQVSGPESLKTKTEILKYLEDSFKYVKKAVLTIDDKNVVSPIPSPFGPGNATRLAMTTLIIGHCNDHYGQMVEYLRMNGIVPPASQR